MTAEQLTAIQPAIEKFLSRFENAFARRPTFEHFKTYLLGLLSDVHRKNVEAIALAADVPVRSLQEFLSQFKWDHEGVADALMRMVADEHDDEDSIGIVDGSAHAKRGDKTPGVQRQWCGETGKIDNCVVGVHLVYTDNHAENPFSCLLESDLYLPQCWIDDAARRAEAGIESHVIYRPKWLIALDLIQQAIGQGVRFSFLTFDEEFGRVPGLWFTLDAWGQRGVGEVPGNFYCWPTPPKYHSQQQSFAPKRVDHVVKKSDAFRKQGWQTLTIKKTTRGRCVWRVKAARVQLVNTEADDPGAGKVKGRPTDRRYWLIVAENVETGETKYFVSNASESTSIEKIMRAAFARWHVEKSFERAKQFVGFGDFEVRKHVGLTRHWLCCRLAMFFLGRETKRVRGKKTESDVRAVDPRGAGLFEETSEHLAWCDA